MTLDTLRDLTAQITDASRALDSLRMERDGIIRGALATGTSVEAVVTATGLTRARVYQIRSGVFRAADGALTARA